MIELLYDPAVWASFLTLVTLEIILGIDNVVFISITASRLPEHQRAKARMIGLAGALILRILLLFSIAWIISLTKPILELFGHEVSWRDIILISGGFFLIYKSATEIFNAVEGNDHQTGSIGKATMFAVVSQIIMLDLVFSVDSVITAVGIADHIPVMVAAVVIAVGVMMAAANPIANFVEAHPSTKMLALAFLTMIGMSLVAEGAHFHVERGFIYAAMVFAGFVETLNLLQAKKRKRQQANSEEVTAQ